MHYSCFIKSHVLIFTASTTQTTKEKNMKIKNLNLLTQDELKELIERTYATLSFIAMNNPSMPNEVLELAKRGCDFEDMILGE